MRGPCGRSDQIAFDVHRVVARARGLVLPAAECDFVLHGRIATALPPSEHIGCGQDLRSMAYGRDRFVLIREVANDLEDARMEPQVLRGAAAGQDQRIVGGGIDRCEIGVEREAMAGFFAIRLVAIEVVDGGGDVVARFLVRACGMACVPDHEEHLIGDHDFIVFYEVTDEEQDFLGCHNRLLEGRETIGYRG